MSSKLTGCLSAGYGKRTILKEASFEIKSGELVALVGANGCGKTTLMKSICGIIPYTGKIFWNDLDLNALDLRKKAGLITYVPQKSGITIDLSVLDVVLMGFNPHLKVLQSPTKAMVEDAKKALARVGLSGREQENYLTLSEGQKQLCIWARALVSRGQLMLLDEPESSLDFQCRYDMLDALREWIRAEDRAGLVILHDINMALNCCDRLLVISGGTISDVITMGTDSHKTMEQALEKVYGTVSIVTCQNHAKKEQIVMLKG